MHVRNKPFLKREERQNSLLCVLTLIKLRKEQLLETSTLPGLVLSREHSRLLVI